MSQPIDSMVLTDNDIEDIIEYHREMMQYTDDPDEISYRDQRITIMEKKLAQRHHQRYSGG